MNLRDDAMLYGTTKDKSNCPWQGEAMPYSDPCYVCSLGIRRALRDLCPYYELWERIKNERAEMERGRGEEGKSD